MLDVPVPGDLAGDCCRGWEAWVGARGVERGRAALSRGHGGPGRRRNEDGCGGPVWGVPAVGARVGSPLSGRWSAGVGGSLAPAARASGADAAGGGGGGV